MDYLDFLRQELHQAGELAKNYFGKVSGTTKPGDNNQVLTAADVAIGEYLIGRIKATYPDHNIIDEEAGAIDNGSNCTWVIDPIEATSNFAAGVPNYGIMVGLLRDDQPYAGGIIVPAHNKLYLAERGKGTTCNDQVIHASDESKSSSMLVSYGIDSYVDNPERTYHECQVLADIILAIRNMRNSGCEAIDPMYVAEGRYGARIETTAKIWDCVAPHIICEEAGAIWTDASGQPADYSQPLTRLAQNFTFCVAAPNLHQQLVDIIDGRL